ncbi:MAG: CPBP family glutamic-type intramembrane protease [candidate division KSB1 bacterium]|nr:CPBP family glutamic-type intramembrane protease [candidate division KSB1 bacterium]MDZ7365058.1 CPBP family glutamic-type intramembrane protease [candidate division KSB1 bacterium]MDZ7403452.1 CPBP family glutamic-type intramembrane protease [candidate division KSB1 bacterium]
MFRKPIFWLALSAASIGAVIFTVKYFSEAFPIVTLDLQMNREQALAAARELAQKHQWTPAEFKQAASFRLDQEVQNFVELEGGGKEAFGRMLKEGLYSPYTWRVRHFKEGETHETLIRFTPKGEPYGFAQKLPERETGAALDADSAHAIAESAASAWKIDLSQYQLTEKSQETRLGGRIDHTFVYERPHLQIGEGRYRLRLVVGGDKLTELTHFVKVPEAFSRRYEEMRSANDTIGVAGSVALVVLYLIGGCGVGLFFLLRERWVIWRKPLFWGLFVSFLQLLAGLNQWPLLWMNYDTALSSQGFVLQQIMRMLAQFVLMGILLTVSFMAAESLSRRAFPHHIQQWRLWSPDAAASKPVLGRTIGGYLLVALFFAYEVVLYFFANKSLGWWTPSDTLVNPDVLAGYFPWLSAIAISLQAGFWEESLFRAVPIAGAALIGQKYGYRRAFIIGAMIVQALIFGSGHAGYANQPAYARVVELIIPSFAFGALYIYFGLLPAIILHFAFDVVWFALPLFVSTAPGIWIDRALVIILTLVPLWVVLRARIRSAKWGELEQQHYNRAWIPAPKAEVQPVVAEAAKPGAISAKAGRLLLAAGVLGLIAWFVAANFQSDAPALTITRSEAENLARQTLAERGIELPSPWQALSSVQAQPDEQDRFIWQKGGKKNYGELIGAYLPPPQYKIRFVKFEGDVAERAEEYQVFIDNAGKAVRFRHELPEARLGDSLSVEAARPIAHAAITTTFQMDPLTLKEVSAVASKRPARQDWTFEFADTLNYSLKEGEARLAVKIAGKEVVDVYRYIHVPEEWTRQERKERNLPQIVQAACVIMNVLLVIAGVVGAIVAWSRKNFSVKTFLRFLALLFGLNMISLINSWPALVAQFSTAQPFKTQAFIFIAGGLIGVLFLAFALALVIGFVQKWRREQTPLEISKAFAWGPALGALAAGVMALTVYFAPSLKPVWAAYDAAGTFVPLLKTALEPLSQFLTQGTILLLVFTAMDRFTLSWTKRKAWFSALLMLVGLIVAGARSVETLPFWLLSGVAMGLILLLAYVFVLRFHLALVPLAAGVITVLAALKQGIYQAVPAALPGALIATVLIGVVAFYWFKQLAREKA